jgi:N-acetylneuraminic acid mutarotase
MSVFWLLACSGGAQDPTAVIYEQGWNIATPLLEPLQEHSTVVVDGNVVILGGFELGWMTSTRTEAYDPETGSWSSWADLPEKVHHAQVATVDGSIYVLGVLEGLTMSANSVAWVLDSPSAEWTEVTPLPQGAERGGGAAVHLNGRVHVVGGRRDGEAVTDHHVYDPVSDSWASLASMDQPLDHLGGVVIEGRIYAVGGRDKAINAHTDALSVYDPEADSWASLASMPTSRGGVAVATVAGLLYVFGGEGNADTDSGVFAQSEVYDPATDQWTSLFNMPTPRHGLGAGVVDGQIYLPGGGDTESLGVVDIHEVYVPGE